MNLLLSILAGLFAGVVAFWFGNYVGFPQPLLGIVAFVIFVVIAYLGYEGKWFGRR